MSAIFSYMSAGHRDCDTFYADAESAVAEQKWPEANQQWTLFTTALLHHLRQEEELLFPAFEQATGNTNGPTAVMRMEHEQMRALVDAMSAAMASQDDEHYLGLAETLMILMQQHNMKEEQMLYPMSDRMIPATGQLVSTLQEL